jgi:protein TonB
MTPTEPEFNADIAERRIAGAAPEKPRRALAWVIAGLVYAFFAGLVALENHFEVVAPPPPAEIPIEIVAEPPPPPPETPAPAPTPPPAPPPAPEEAPATDAPKDSTDKTATDGAGAVSKTPPAPPPVKPPGQKAAQPGDPGPKPDAANPGKEASPDPVKDKTVSEPDPNGEAKPAAPEPPQAKAELETPPEKPSASPGAPKPLFDSVPDIDFEAAAKAAIVGGGNARATYFSILYGLIVPKVHRPAGARLKSNRSSHGAIVFSVDGRGNLTERFIAQSCGWPELDAAAFEAIGRAAPFPPPPRGMPISVRFSYED